jgi:hypothetical protein
VIPFDPRNVAQCPVELNLVPKSILKRQQFEQKKPYFIAAVFSLVLVVFAYGWFFDRVAQVKASSLEDFQRHLRPLLAKEAELIRIESQINASKNQANAVLEKVRWRLFWPDVLQELRDLLLLTEVRTEQEHPGWNVGVWIEQFGTTTPALADAGEGSDQSQSSFFGMSEELRRRYHLPEPALTPKQAKGEEGIPVKFRAINLNRFGDSAANAQLAFAVGGAIQASPFFDETGTKMSGELEQVGRDRFTFTFEMTVKLRPPSVNR